MLFEYQVFYRLVEGVNGEAKPIGPIQTIIVRAGKGRPEDARKLVESMDGVQVCGVAPWKAVLDWNQQNFDRDEAAEFFRKSPDTVDRYVREGKLPKAQNGYPVFTKRMLDRVIDETMKETQ